MKLIFCIILYNFIFFKNRKKTIFENRYIWKFDISKFCIFEKYTEMTNYYYKGGNSYRTRCYLITHSYYRKSLLNPPQRENKFRRSTCEPSLFAYESRLSTSDYRASLTATNANFAPLPQQLAGAGACIKHYQRLTIRRP